MSYNVLDASSYEYSLKRYKENFKSILSGIITCYNRMLSSGFRHANDEKAIQLSLVNTYLKNDIIKEQIPPLSNYHFEAETIEKDGRADIKIIPVCPYLGDKAYYIIECKRIDNNNLQGISGLNAEYIKNGICRFVTGYYSSYYKVNGMIGFVVSEIDIHENSIIYINSLLNQELINDKKQIVSANPIEEISRIELLPDFKYSYKSKHKTISNNEIILYHLMLDFSNHIQ